MNGIGWKDWLYTAFTISTYLFLFNYYQNRYDTLLLAILAVLSVAIYCQLFQCVLHPDKWMVADTKELHGFLLGGNYNQMNDHCADNRLLEYQIRQMAEAESWHAVCLLLCHSLHGQVDDVAVLYVPFSFS